MTELFQNINGIYVIFLFALCLGGFLAGRRGRNKEITAATEQLNDTLKAEVDALRRRVSDLEQDRDKQDGIMDAIRYALRQYHLRVVINGKFVTLVDENGQQSKVTRIRPKKTTLAPMPPEDADDDETAN